MNAHRSPQTKGATAGTRRPRIALMGEFSAGKSTLANLLLGERVSPVKVTATQLPPVWYRHGSGGLVRIDKAGAEHALSADALERVSHADTQAVRVPLVSEVLEFCDIIDMPGTSDPNMPPEVWERMLSRCDAVVWCTPATQAWRQSEAAVWDGLPEALRARSLLLITRIDKMQSPRDRDRVLARVRRETDGLFAQVMPISLTDALAEPDNADTLRESGAEAFSTRLAEMVEEIGLLHAEAQAGFEAVAEAEPQGATRPAASAPLSDSGAAQASGTVIPRRVIPKKGRRTMARP